jgi:K+-transporting ATPase KdpF subunit
MTPDLALGLGFSAFALVYLLIALIRPERF